MVHLTLPVPQWQRLIREAWPRPQAALRLPVSLQRRGEDTELLAVPAQRDGDPCLHVHLTDDGSRITDHGSRIEALGGLVLGRDGRLSGAVRIGGDWEPLQCVSFPGPGMYPLEAKDRGADEGSEHGNGKAPEGRWTRTVGALGAEVWGRLVSLRYGLVGLGRTGSQVALALARLGVRRLTLVDADRLEPHNLGEMVGVTEADVGRLKVEALAEACRRVWPEAQVETCPASITTLRALLAVRDCDVLFCCADHDAARLATATIATAYHRVLVDVGTGVLHRATTTGEGENGRGRGLENGRGEEQPQSTASPTPPFPHSPILPFPYSPTSRTMGLDVRLVLPADRCLLCLGGVSDPTLAQSVLQSAAAERAFLLGRDWRHERAGSLFSLNQVAVGLALRLWEDLVAGRVRESVWLHLEDGEDGVPSLQRVLTERHAVCPLCAQAGRGEAGLQAIEETLGMRPERTC